MEPGADNLSQLRDSSSNFLSNLKSTSDLTIICGKQTFLAHRAVVCAKSEYFRSALKAHTKEAASGTIELEDQHPTVVEAMLYFFYFNDYQHHCDPISDAMIFHVAVYCLAHQYCIDTLQQASTNKFAKLANHSWREPSFFAAVHHLFEHAYESDNPLKEFVVQDCVYHFNDLFLGRNVANQDHLKNIPGLGQLLAVRLMQKYSHLVGKEAQCPFCSNTWTWGSNWHSRSIGTKFCPECGHRGTFDHFSSKKAEPLKTKRPSGFSSEPKFPPESDSSDD